MGLLLWSRRGLVSFGVWEGGDTGKWDGLGFDFDGGAGLDVAEVGIVLGFFFVVGGESDEISLWEDDFFEGVKISGIDAEAPKGWLESGFEVEDAAVDEVGEGAGNFASAFAVGDEDGDGVAGRVVGGEGGGPGVVGVGGAGFADLGGSGFGGDEDVFHGDLAEGGATGFVCGFPHAFADDFELVLGDAFFEEVCFDDGDVFFENFFVPGEVFSDDAADDAGLVVAASVGDG